MEKVLIQIEAVKGKVEWLVRVNGKRIASSKSPALAEAYTTVIEDTLKHLKIEYETRKR